VAKKRNIAPAATDSIATDYQHGHEATQRPDVGVQDQFTVRKPPRNYRYDSSPAHATRKLLDLHASSKCQVAVSALQRIDPLYEIEREVKDLTPDERQRIRQARSRSLLDALHRWMQLMRQKITEGSVSAKALEYRLNRWAALTRFAGEEGSAELVLLISLVP
jgi:Transposase IS66 family